METHQLKKAVVPKIGKSMPAGWVIAFAAIGLLLASNFVLFVRGGSSAFARDTYQKALSDSWKVRDRLKEENALLRRRLADAASCAAPAAPARTGGPDRASEVFDFCVLSLRDQGPFWNAGYRSYVLQTCFSVAMRAQALSFDF